MYIAKHHEALLISFAFSLLCVAGGFGKVFCAEPYPNGSPRDPAFFPIGFWLLSPDRAPQYKVLGFNTFVGLWEGPKEKQLATLSRHEDISYYDIASRNADVPTFDICPVGTSIPEVKGKLDYVVQGGSNLMQRAKRQQRVRNAIEAWALDPEKPPRPEEVPAEVWMSLVKGSTGIEYFAQECSPFREDEIFAHPDIVAKLKSINQCIGDLAPIQNNPNETNATIVLSAVPIATVVKHYSTSLYVFAVSMKDQQTAARISISNVQEGEAVAIGENRVLKVSMGRFDDSFVGYGVHICKITRAGDYADGAVNAPVGAPQMPDLFSRYTVRPPWNVAGVDYYVGVPSLLALKNAGMASNLPTGANLDRSKRIIFVSANDVTLDSLDFSSDGGYGIYIYPGVSGTRITRNLFVANSTTAPIPVNIALGASNTYIAYNTMDGGGVNGNSTFGEMIFNLGEGLTIEYNWIRNAPARFVSTDGGLLVYRHNLLQNGGWIKGAHLNFLQFGRGHSSHPQVSFNTLVQGRTIVGGEGFQMYMNFSGSIYNGEISYNTMVSKRIALTGTSGSPAISYWIHAGSNRQYPSISTGAVHDNYIDISSAYGAMYPGLKGFSQSNNVNLLTGSRF